MESRQVILLTKGYLAGWLDFKYPNRLSYLREAYILSQIEKDMTMDIIRLRSSSQNHFIGVNPKEGGKSAQKVLDDYSQILLPYTSKSGKMKQPNPQTADDWKALIDKIKTK